MTTPALALAAQSLIYTLFKYQKCRGRIHRQDLKVVLDVCDHIQIPVFAGLSVAHSFSLFFFINVSFALFESLAILPLKPHILTLAAERTKCSLLR